MLCMYGYVPLLSFVFVKMPYLRAVKETNDDDSQDSSNPLNFIEVRKKIA